MGFKIFSLEGLDEEEEEEEEREEEEDDEVEEEDLYHHHTTIFQGMQAMTQTEWPRGSVKI